MLTCAQGRNKFGKTALHNPALRYDLNIVMEVFANCVDESGATVLSNLDVSWIDMNVLAFLQGSKRQMESELAQLNEQAIQLWDATAAGLSLVGDPTDEYSDTIPPCSFWPSVRLPETSTVAEFDLGPEIQRPVALWPRRSAPGNPLITTSDLGHRCPQCSCGRGLIERDTELGDVVLVSAWCMFCGWSTGADPFAAISPVAAPLFLLAQVLLSELIRGYRSLLRLVTATVAVLLSLLRSAGYQCAIVISQRNFFTHHGAHPPRVQPLRRAPGLLSGMAFQLQVAA
jgi:hypothetical protein